jgi:hypothetical protein
MQANTAAASLSRAGFGQMCARVVAKVDGVLYSKLMYL